jgi:hypothetical protein
VHLHKKEEGGVAGGGLQFGVKRQAEEFLHNGVWGLGNHCEPIFAGKSIWKRKGILEV